MCTPTRHSGATDRTLGIAYIFSWRRARLPNIVSKLWLALRSFKCFAAYVTDMAFNIFDGDITVVHALFKNQNQD